MVTATVYRAALSALGRCNWQGSSIATAVTSLVQTAVHAKAIQDPLATWPQVDVKGYTSGLATTVLR